MRGRAAVAADLGGPLPGRYGPGPTGPMRGRAACRAAVAWPDGAAYLGGRAVPDIRKSAGRPSAAPANVRVRTCGPCGRMSALNKGGGPSGPAGGRERAACGRRRPSADIGERRHQRTSEVGALGWRPDGERRAPSAPSADAQAGSLLYFLRPARERERRRRGGGLMELPCQSPRYTAPPTGAMPDMGAGHV